MALLNFCKSSLLLLTTFVVLSTEVEAGKDKLLGPSSNADEKRLTTSFVPIKSDSDLSSDNIGVNRSSSTASTSTQTHGQFQSVPVTSIANSSAAHEKKSNTQWMGDDDDDPDFWNAVAASSEEAELNAKRRSQVPDSSVKQNVSEDDSDFWAAVAAEADKASLKSQSFPVFSAVSSSTVQKNDGNPKKRGSGGNGAGKSTLFNVISGFLKPNHGQIFFDDNNVTQTPQSARAKSISKVMQDPKLGTMENMTLYENMAFALKRGESRILLPFANRGRRDLFREKLSLLGMGLENRLDDITASLSGGQRQALSLVMAIISDSQILLLDEITGALDPKMAEIVMELSNQIIRKENRTSLMITHNMAHAIAYGDRIVVLKNGKITKEFGPLEKKSLTPKDLNEAFLE